MISVIPRCQPNRMPRKKKVISTRIFDETGCNQILARILLVKSPTKGINVLYFPFLCADPFGENSMFLQRARKVTPAQAHNLMTAGGPIDLISAHHSARRQHRFPSKP